MAVTQALGMIETKGLVASIEAADAMVKAANVTQMCIRDRLKYKKTQAVEIINKNMIDTPGEYLERTYMRGALMVSAADADTIVLVQDATENGTMFPPGYSSSFAKPCIGVVTKSDKATEKQLEDAQKYLKIAGAKEIFVTSSYEGTGFEPVSYTHLKSTDFSEW